MFGVGKKVSFSVVIALVIGWGVLGVLFIQTTSTLLQAQTYELDQPPPLPSGVRLNVQVDKKIYRSGESVLLAIRNDSRLTIWLASHADGCTGSWWQVEILGPDGETWSPLTMTKDSCPKVLFGFQSFGRHTLKTDVWLAAVPSNQIGNVMTPAPTGTYRIVAPYLRGKVTTEELWTSQPIRTVVSPSFTLE